MSVNPNRVVFVCNCGDEITVDVKPEEENQVTCAKCGQEYRFFGQSVLRWSSSGQEEH